MNNSFEQFTKNHRNPKTLNQPIQPNTKQLKLNKYKLPSNSYNDLINQSLSNYSSVISNSSLNKNIAKSNTTKSNQKKKKQQSINLKSNRPSSGLKKCVTIQLSKKQKQIRQAIQYRFQKSKLKQYKLSQIIINQKNNPYQDDQIRQILDLQEQEKFAQQYAQLKQLKTVNLYEYHKKRSNLFIKPQKDKSNNKIIVIKNNKKKRQNSQSLIQFTHHDNQMHINSKYFAENHPGFNKNQLNLKSQRNHLQSHHSRNKSQHPYDKGFKLQFLKNYKPFTKQKSGSRSKIIKTEHSHYQSETGIKQKKQKMHLSSSVEKNFKSIKDIYLNALTNLANKNTVKTNKLMKNNLQSNNNHNKCSKNYLYGSEKKSSKNEHKNLLTHQRTTSNHQSSSLIQPPNNYFSCISSRQNNLKQSTSFYIPHCKDTKQKLEKTLLISQSNPAQWKSIVLKIGDDDNSLQENKINKKKLKIKTKQDSFSGNFNKNNKKLMIQPHSHRQYTKSPKYKRFIISEEQQYNSARPKNLTGKNFQSIKSIKNIDRLSNQKEINISHSSICKDSKGFSKKYKK